MEKHSLNQPYMLFLSFTTVLLWRRMRYFYAFCKHMICFRDEQIKL